MRRLVLASGSPARRWLLESAGLSPEVVVSHVDEDGTDHLSPDEAVAALAQRKGRAVATRVDGPSALILACDSMLEYGNERWSKAASPDEVVRRWRLLRGGRGYLHTGHYLLDVATGREETRTDTAVVSFGSPTDEEIEAYAATPEALQVAGPFTLEGRSAPWIDSIEGNYGTVTGVSLSLVRRMLAALHVPMTDLRP